MICDEVILAFSLCSLLSTFNIVKHDAGELIWFGHGLVTDMVEEAAEFGLLSLQSTEHIQYCQARRR